MVERHEPELTPGEWARQRADEILAAQATARAREQRLVQRLLAQVRRWGLGGEG